MNIKNSRILHPGQVEFITPRKPHMKQKNTPHKRTRKIKFFDGEYKDLIYTVECNCPINQDHCEITTHPQTINS